MQKQCPEVLLVRLPGRGSHFGFLGNGEQLEGPECSPVP